MSEPQASVLPAERVIGRPRSLWTDALHGLLHNRAGVAGLTIVGALAVLAIIGPFIAPWDYRVIGPVVVAVSLGLPAAVLAESTLSFLGLGVQAPRASWGARRPRPPGQPQAVGQAAAIIGR